MAVFESRSITVVSLWTDKMAETLDFYGRVLGLKRCPCVSYHMTPPHFELGGAYLVLLNGKTELQEGSDHFPAVAITVDDLENAFEVLKENGIPVLHGIQEDSSSRWLFCRDPGGNLIELAVWK